MKTVKWIIAGLASGFSAGGALLAAGQPMDQRFWFIFAGGVVFGLAGIATNKAIDSGAGKDE